MAMATATLWVIAVRSLLPNRHSAGLLRLDARVFDHVQGRSQEICCDLTLRAMLMVDRAITAKVKKLDTTTAQLTLKVERALSRVAKDPREVLANLLQLMPRDRFSEVYGSRVEEC